MPNVMNEELDAFARRVRPSVERYVSSQVRQRDDCEEIVGHVFLALSRTWDSFRGDCPSEAYAIHIAANAIKNYYTRDVKKKNRQISLDEWVDGYSLQHNPELVCPYKRLESVDWVEALLREMNSCCSQAECGIVGMYYQGMSMDEISRLIGMNASTVRGHFLRARKKLLAHMFIAAPELMGGRLAIQQLVEKVARENPKLFSMEELAVVRSGGSKSTDENLRSAMMKVAQFFEDFI